MLTIKFRWKGKCPRHPRFNPAIQGEVAIKGGCPACAMLCQVAKAERNLISVAGNFDEIQRVALVVNIRRTASVRQIEKRA